MLDTAQSKVASRHIADVIREEILDGTLGPGTHIRQEELADRFGTSRLPVREALRILETDGLVVTHANRGARIPHLTLAECDELYRTREVLEPMLLTDSVPVIAAETINAMKALQDRMDAGSATIEDYLDLDRRFHMLSYSGAQLPYIRSTVEQLLNRTQHYRRAHAVMVRENTFRLQQLHSDHHAILLAIERRDAVEASQLMHLHTRRARLELSNHPELFAAD
jgi:DNA-binding GntR family transcriptional regulator